MQLPADFITQMERMMAPELWHVLREGLAQEPSVSIRINPSKIDLKEWEVVLSDGVVPWCEYGFYLTHRPPFTFDPLLHAGAYYVQESSSMFLHQVLRQYVTEPVAMLDLCAAPGGKSTLARSVLPEGSRLVSNEPMRGRAQVLEENVTKWGYPDHIVTNRYPKDFRKSKQQFDVILTDVPCSGEGMFRKDEGAIAEWSLQKVEQCQRLQREIVSDAWECLVPGGLLIYSTCTFNTLENEENIKWILENFDAEVLPVHTEAEWNIQGSILPDFIAPIYRFIPGLTRGEGLFMAVIGKRGERSEKTRVSNKSLSSLLTPLSSINIDIDYPTALRYLRREAIVLPPDAPRGIVTVSYQGIPLGQCKNIGSRANNLYPKEWRIKSTHTPDYEAILRHT
jgi:16S rRNA C967 or C1407 C5-methylase (RsmB/RsmF family)